MRITAIEIPWADGEFKFDLRLGEIRNLQEKTGIGPPVILQRLQNDQWKVDDYRETILQGLMGGGRTAKEASELVKKWVDNRPAVESILPAQSILLSWLVGVPEKKPEAVETQTEAETAPAASTSPQSTDQVPQSDLLPAT
jgi:hypothetical protein